jgi:hypothetical protein
MLKSLIPDQQVGEFEIAVINMVFSLSYHSVWTFPSLRRLPKRPLRLTVKSKFEKAFDHINDRKL